MSSRAEPARLIDLREVANVPARPWTGLGALHCGRERHHAGSDRRPGKTILAPNWLMGPASDGLET